MKAFKLIIIFLMLGGLFFVTTGTGDVFLNGARYGNINAVTVTAVSVTADSADIGFDNYKQPTYLNIDADRTISAVETGALFVAVTIGAKRTYSLPEAAIGLTFSFLVDDSDSLLITCQSGDGITDETNVYSTYSSDAGSFTITAFNTSNWAVISRVGTWVPY